MKIKSDNTQRYDTYIGMHVYIYMKKIYDLCGLLSTLDKRHSDQKGILIVYVYYFTIQGYQIHDQQPHFPNIFRQFFKVF